MHANSLVWTAAVLLVFCSSKPAVADEYSWPPEVGKPYPDLRLTDQSGKEVQLSSFRGKVILLEPVGMSCPACQAFVGGHERGPFKAVRPQSGLQSIEEYFPKYAKGTKLPNREIVHVQLVLFDMKLGAPSTEDLKAWAEHFGVEASKNQYVLAGTPDLLDRKNGNYRASYDMIPGFQLIDKSFVLRSDSSGHRPKHDLFTEFLPLVPALLKERAPRRPRASAGAAPPRDRAGASKKAKAVLSMARSYEENGLVEKARERYESLLADHPGTPEAEEARARLDALGGD